VPRVEMVQVYNVQVSVANCDEQAMHAVDWPQAPNERPYDRDQYWVYDELDDALTRIRKVLPTMPKGAMVMLDLDVMSLAEYAALPPD
jgi:hypothetical protein